jgi:hypothetical protein
MKTWKVFYFLWGDPLFSESIQHLATYIDDELIQLRREEILEAVDGWFQIQAAQAKRIEELNEDVAREIWTWKQLLEHVPQEIKEKIGIERRINMMDPDFSFSKVVFPDRKPG